MEYIQLTADNIEKEHICCAFSDKKCQESYNLKKEWLKRQFENGYVFRRLNERAKVFIEYGPAENGWVPVKADNYLLINCFWVAGQYKGKGYAKALLQTAIDDALQQGADIQLKCRDAVGGIRGNSSYVQSHMTQATRGMRDSSVSFHVDDVQRVLSNKHGVTLVEVDVVALLDNIAT